MHIQLFNILCLKRLPLDFQVQMSKLELFYEDSSQKIIHWYLLVVSIFNNKYINKSYSRKPCSIHALCI